MVSVLHLSNFKPGILPNHLTIGTFLKSNDPKRDVVTYVLTSVECAFSKFVLFLNLMTSAIWLYTHAFENILLNIFLTCNVIVLTSVFLLNFFFFFF